MPKSTKHLSGDTAPANAFMMTGGRLLIALLLLLTPILYDKGVPEVAGDPRWTFAHLISGIGITFVALFYLFRQSLPTLTLPLVGWVALLYLLWVTISAATSVAPGSAKQEWFNQLSYVGVFLLVFFLRDAKWYRNLLWVLALPLALNCLIAICQFLQWTDATIRTVIPFWPQQMFDYFAPAAPPAGSLSNKNLLGSYLALSLPIFTILALTTKALHRQIFAAVVFALAATAFVYTRSRGSWIALFAAVALFGLWLALDKPLRLAALKALNKRALALFMVATVAVGGASLAQSPLQGFHSIDKTVGEQLGSIAKMSHSDFATRYAYNLNGLKIFLDKPITGWGLGSFHAIYPKYHNAWMATPPVGYGVDLRPQRAHNDWLEAFMELGLIGGLLFISLPLLVLGMSWRLVRTDTVSDQQRMMVAGLTIGLTALWINALGDFPLQMATGPILMWSFMGMIAGMYILHHPQGAFRPRLLVRAHAVLSANRLMPTALLATASVVGAFGTQYILRDDLAYRQANRHLKTVMYNIRQNKFDYTTLRHIDMAYRLYPNNPRILEHRAVMYANYRDTVKEFATDTKIAAVKEALVHDPYAPNNLVNLGGLYMLRLSELLSFSAPREEILRARDEALAITDMLEVVAPMSPATYTIKGYTHLYTRNLPEAVKALERALEIDPDYVPAVNGLNAARQQMANSGWISVGPAKLDNLAPQQ
jgi:O-antigen ligase/Flp pilus assembly protein TadD